MFVPYLADVVMHRWPIANWVLIGVTVVISCAMFGTIDKWEGDNEGIALANHFLHQSMDASPPEGALDYMLLQPHHFHFSQLIGNTLIHGGFLHLLGNMLFLWVFGNAVNAKLGQWQYLALYFGAAIFEGMVYVLLGPRVPSLGASGAIMGIVGAFLVLYPRNDIRIFCMIYLRPVVFNLSSMWLIVIYIALDIWGLAQSGGSGVAYISHVAGAAVGIVTLWVLVHLGKVESDECEENILQVFGWKAKLEPALVTPARPAVPFARPAPLEPPKPLPPLELD